MSLKNKTAQGWVDVWIHMHLNGVQLLEISIKNAGAFLGLKNDFDYFRFL